MDVAIYKREHGFIWGLGKNCTWCQGGTAHKHNSDLILDVIKSVLCAYTFFLGQESVSSIHWIYG